MLEYSSNFAIEINPHAYSEKKFNVEYLVLPNGNEVECEFFYTYSLLR